MGANPLVVVQLLTALLTEIRGRKAEKTANVLTEVLESYTNLDALFQKIDAAIESKTPLTLTEEDLMLLDDLAGDIRALMVRLKLKK